MDISGISVPAELRATPPAALELFEAGARNLALCGRGSTELAAFLDRPGAGAAGGIASGQALSDFFGPVGGGAEDLWHIAAALLGQPPPAAVAPERARGGRAAPRVRRAVGLGEVLGLKRGQAELLESKRAGLAARAAVRACVCAVVRCEPSGRTRVVVQRVLALCSIAPRPAAAARSVFHLRPHPSCFPPPSSYDVVVLGGSQAGGCSAGGCLRASAVRRNRRGVQVVMQCDK